MYCAHLLVFFVLFKTGEIFTTLEKFHFCSFTEPVRAWQWVMAKSLGNYLMERYAATW